MGGGGHGIPMTLRAEAFTGDDSHNKTLTRSHESCAGCGDLARPRPK